MASSVFVANRLSGKTSRIKLEGVDIKGKVAELRSKTAKAIDVPIHEIELLYGGKCLQDVKSLDFYGVRTGCTIHATKKVNADQGEQLPEPMDNTSIQQVVTALQSALANPAYRNTVEQMLSSPETLENLIAATPGLEKDHVAIAMLQDPELLAILADPNHIHRVIEAHPALGQAAMTVATAVNEEGASASAGSSRATYSMDQMSDDEDMPVRRQPGGQAITTSQLEAALMAAGSQSASSSSSSAQRSSEGANARSDITSDFLQQAMLSAMQGGQSAPSSEQPAVTEAALQQLRDMGITDEAVARQALEATGGNIQAALEFIFGGS